jgi:sec-independent protein translocase protein TatB
MFDIGWTELLIIGVVALIAIGPKELPGVLRTVGQMMAKVRRMAAEFQGQFQEALREAEMEDLKKHVDSLTEGLDPMESVRKEIEAATEDTSAPPSRDPDPTQGGLYPEAQPATATETVAAPETAVAPVAQSSGSALPQPEPAVAGEAEVKEAGGRAA